MSNDYGYLVTFLVIYPDRPPELKTRVTCYRPVDNMLRRARGDSDARYVILNSEKLNGDEEVELGRSEAQPVSMVSWTMKL